MFTVACEPYLESEYGSEWAADAPVKLLDLLYNGMPRQAGEQVVVIGQVLADDATLGYEDISNVQVSTRVHDVWVLTTCRVPAALCLCATGISTRVHDVWVLGVTSMHSV